MAFQNITGLQLAQAALTTSYATVYTTPLNTRTYVKSLDLCNTGSAQVQVYVHLVPSGGTAGTTNAILYNIPIPGYSTLQWCGAQIMNAGGTLQVKASATGCTLTATGGEAT